MQVRMAAENGVDGAVDHLHRTIYGSLLSGHSFKWGAAASGSSSSMGAVSSSSSASDAASSAAASSATGVISDQVRISLPAACVAGCNGHLLIYSQVMFVIPDRKLVARAAGNAGGLD